MDPPHAGYIAVRDPGSRKRHAETTDIASRGHTSVHTPRPSLEPSAMRKQDRNAQLAQLLDRSRRSRSCSPTATRTHNVSRMLCHCARGHHIEGVMRLALARPIMHGSGGDHAYRVSCGCDAREVVRLDRQIYRDALTEHRITAERTRVTHSLSSTSSAGSEC